MKILNGDCLEQLKTLEDASIDSVVTDPPYGLAFMNKHWDYDVPSTEVWSEVLRVLKPGGHLLSFGGTRTYHRMVVAIEDAGFEIRDQIQWLYGSGFPKSHNIGKAMDKAAGTLKEVGTGETCPDIRADNYSNSQGKQRLEIKKSVPNSDLAKQWEGWGTALKPANEPIVLARKPFKGTVAKCVEEHGTGALNIDGCRIEGLKPQVIQGINSNPSNFNVAKKRRLSGDPNIGRWPANVILDEVAGEMLDAQSGVLKNGGQNYSTKGKSMFGTEKKLRITDRAGDSGGASRFFYCAKASKSERNAGLEHLVKEKQGARPNSKDPTGKFPDHDHRPTGGNNHPTVKPIKLMRYLVRLITPPGGTVLDPYCGSGTTGVAAKLEGMEFVGIEREQEYIEIAERRIEHASL